MTRKPLSVVDTAIKANLDALRERLDVAKTMTLLAHSAMADGNRNLAMGTILDLETALPECTALYGAIIALHRSRLADDD